jgi:hypothetical protein
MQGAAGPSLAHTGQPGTSSPNTELPSKGSGVSEANSPKASAGDWLAHSANDTLPALTTAQEANARLRVFFHRTAGRVAPSTLVAGVPPPAADTSSVTAEQGIGRPRAPHVLETAGGPDSVTKGDGVINNVTGMAKSKLVQSLGGPPSRGAPPPSVLLSFLPALLEAVVSPSPPPPPPPPPAPPPPLPLPLLLAANSTIREQLSGVITAFSEGHLNVVPGVNPEHVVDFSENGDGTTTKVTLSSPYVRTHTREKAVGGGEGGGEGGREGGRG